MEIQERISRQRVKHIVESYQLDGDDVDAFKTYLEDLLKTFAHPLIELAVTEVLAKSWAKVPMTRGLAFLTKVHNRLKEWQSEPARPITSSLTPAQFEQITGLDSMIIFDVSGTVKPLPRSSQSAPESL